MAKSFIKVFGVQYDIVSGNFIQASDQKRTKMKNLDGQWLQAELMVLLRSMMIMKI